MAASVIYQGRVTNWTVNEPSEVVEPRCLVIWKTGPFENVTVEMAVDMEEAVEGSAWQELLQGLLSGEEVRCECAIKIERQKRGKGGPPG